MGQGHSSFPSWRRSRRQSKPGLEAQHVRNKKCVWVRSDVVCNHTQAVLSAAVSGI